MEKPTIQRTKSLNVRMSEKTFKEFVEMAHRMDLQPSTCGYLIIKKYMQSFSDSPLEKAADELV